MDWKAKAIVVTACVGVLGGCGNKGPLYVPGVPAGAAWPYPQPTPQPKPTERKPADVPAASDAQR